MRKFTLFFAAICCTVAAQAVDYTVKFAVSGKTYNALGTEVQ